VALLSAAVFLLALGVNMHMTMNVNYLNDLLKASSWQQGYLEAIRETCGILSFFVIAFLAGRSEPRIASAMVLMVGAGLMGYRWLTGVEQVILFSLVWSFGFHIWAPLSGSMQLALSKKGREGQTLGTFGSTAAVGVLLSLGGVFLLTRYTSFGMRNIFLLGGALTALAAVPLFLMPDIRAASTERLPLSRAFGPRYRLYLMLEFLDGMRKQIFILFAILALVKERGVGVDTISLLFLVNQAINIFCAPLAGKLVDRVGERPVLTAYFGGLIAINLLYATLANVNALFFVLLADNAIWMLRVAVPTYANRIVARGERTQLLAMGMTANHIGAVILPLAGGAVYTALGYQFTFYCGAAVSLVSLLLVRLVPSRNGARD
jgi:MFS family permease